MPSHTVQAERSISYGNSSRSPCWSRSKDQSGCLRSPADLCFYASADLAALLGTRKPLRAVCVKQLESLGLCWPKRFAHAIRMRRARQYAALSFPLTDFIQLANEVTYAV